MASVGRESIILQKQSSLPLGTHIHQHARLKLKIYLLLALFSIHLSFSCTWHFCFPPSSPCFVCFPFPMLAPYHFFFCYRPHSNALSMPKLPPLHSGNFRMPAVRLVGLGRTLLANSPWFAPPSHAPNPTAQPAALFCSPSRFGSGPLQFIPLHSSQWPHTRSSFRMLFLASYVHALLLTLIKKALKNFNYLARYM